MPWRPPMMLVSIVGHASFQTAGASGPSTMERSYPRRSGRTVVAGTGAAVATGALPSVNTRYRAAAAEVTRISSADGLERFPAVSGRRRAWHRPGFLHDLRRRGQRNDPALRAFRARPEFPRHPCAAVCFLRFDWASSSPISFVPLTPSARSAVTDTVRRLNIRTMSRALGHANFAAVREAGSPTRKEELSALFPLPASLFPLSISPLKRPAKPAQ